jgi:hypothetical protein
VLALILMDLQQLLVRSPISFLPLVLKELMVPMGLLLVQPVLIQLNLLL